MATPPASRDEFEVAVVCSLPLAYDAVSLLFDQFWDENGDKYGRAIGDTNSYTTGRFGNCDAVLVLLPNTGKISAASATASLRSSYPGLRLVILTGICGGVPTTDTGDEILLGDVIISKTVIQYDYGRQYPNDFVAKDTTEDSLGRPDKNIRSLVAVLETARERDRIETRAAILLKQIQTPAAKRNRHKEDTYQYPGAANDKLFEASYRHKHHASPQCLCAQCHEYSDPVCEESRNLSCDVLGCDDKRVVPRQRLELNRELEHQGCSEEAHIPHIPSIFIGRFGSGDKMLKSGEHRDWIAKRYGVLAFDMEGAGVWDELPCIIVKGVCNYADSHTNNRWKNFAAATAASVAKSLVERYTKTDKSTILQVKRQVEEMMDNKESRECLKDLHQTNPRDDKTRIQRTKGNLLKESYRWVLGHNDFKQWRDDPQFRLLWIKGDPGKGKTMLLCGIIDEIEKSTTMYCLSYFFCQATEVRLSNATAVLRGLIYMIITQRPSLMSHVREKYDSSGKKLFDDGNAWEALSKILMSMLKDASLDDAILIVDALDECVEGLPLLLEFLSQASISSRTKWIVSSRNWPLIEGNLDTAIRGVRLCLELNESSISTAVQVYIRYKVRELAEKKKYDISTRDAVEQHLVSNAHGTFLWVALICQDLMDPTVENRHTKNMLMELYPPGLDPLYIRMMENIGSRDADLCRQILATISVVYRPITLAELSSLIDLPNNYDYDDLPNIIKSCGSFLAIRDNVIYFIHQSAKDFLLNKAPDKILAFGIENQHHIIFSRSLEILSETLKRDVYDLHLPGFPIEQVSLPNPDPLAPIAYSCIYWADHFCGSKRSQNEGAITKFFELACLYWLEALSLLGGVSEGVIAIQKLMKCVQAPQLTRLLDDINRFILFHKRAIDFAPLQVYAAALVFSPSQSTVRRHFAPEEPQWILTKPLVETHWPASLNILEGHTGRIEAITFSQDSSLIASGSSDNTLRLWRTSTGDCIRGFEGHGGRVASVAFSYDSELLASGSGNKTIRLWRVSTGECMQELIGHTNQVHLITFSFNAVLIASASWDNTIRLWSADTGSCMQELQECYGIITIAFSHNSSLLASASRFGTIQLWDVDTGNCIRELNNPDDDRIWSGTFSHGLAHFATAVGRIIKLWSIDTEYIELVRELRCNNYVHSVTFSYDSELIAITSWDGTIMLQRVDTGQCVWKLDINDTRVEFAAFSRDLNLLAVPWMGKTIRLWRADADSDIKEADADSGTQEQKTSGAPVTSLAFSPNLALVASAAVSNDEEEIEFVKYMYHVISIWCAKTGRCLQKLYDHSRVITSIAFSHDSSLLAAASDNNIRIWRTDTGKIVQTLWVFSASSVVTFSHNSSLIAVSSGSEINFWRTSDDVENRDPDSCLEMHQNSTCRIESIAFSHNSELVALSSSNSTIQILCVATGAHVRTLRGHSRPITSIAFSQDSALIASAAKDGTVRLWRVHTGECVQNIYIGAASTNLSITSDDSQVLTDFGYIAIDRNAVSDTVIPAHFSGLGVRRGYSWITWNNNDILRLPAELGACFAAISGSTIAIGCKSGRVVIIRLSKEELAKIYTGIDHSLN